MKNLQTNQLNLGLFSKYRKELMGLATIFIIMCHSPIYGVVMPFYVQKILGNLGLGVDIFLFLSGMGMYNSYNANKSKNKTIIYWFYKRYIRIVIPLIIISIPIFLYNTSSNPQKSLNLYIIELSGFGSLFGYSPLWFIGCILVLYILTPLLNSVLNHQYKWIYVVLISLSCFIYAYTPPYNEIWHFMIQRWPIYILGFALAKDIKNNKSLSITYIIIIPSLLYIFLFFLNHKLNMHFSLFNIQGLVMISISALIIEYLNNNKLNKLLSFMGIISLESYITNEYLLRTLSTFSWTINGHNINPGNWTFYFGGTAICIVISYLANLLSKKIINNITI